MTEILTRLLTTSQLLEELPWLRPGTLKAFLFWRTENGLEASGAIIRIGRKLLIDPVLFIEFLRTNPSIKGGK